MNKSFKTFSFITGIFYPFLCAFSANMDELPEHYMHHTLTAMDETLKEFSYESLLSAKAGHAKAQNAILVKITNALHEFQNMDIEQRLDQLLIFWKKIGEVN